MNARTAIVIDDDKAICDVVCMILVIEGYNIVGVYHNSKDALSAMGYDTANRSFNPEKLPDTVVTDNDMESKNAGMGVVRALRGSGVGVVLMTAKDGMTQQQVTLAGGKAARFIAKPFSICDLSWQTAASIHDAIVEKISIVGLSKSYGSA